MLVFDTLITAHDGCLIWIKLGKFFQQLEEFRKSLWLAVNNDCSVGLDIDHDLTHVRLRFIRFGGRRYSDVQFILAESKIPSDDEKHQNNQKNVDHRRDHKPKNPGLRLFAKIH